MKSREPEFAIFWLGFTWRLKQSTFILAIKPCPIKKQKNKRQENFSVKQDFIWLINFTSGWTLTWMWTPSVKKGGASWRSVPGASPWPPVGEGGFVVVGIKRDWWRSNFLVISDLYRTFILLASSLAYSEASSLFFRVRCLFRATRRRLCCSTRGVTSLWILGALVLGFLPNRERNGLKSQNGK